MSPQQHTAVWSKRSCSLGCSYFSYPTSYVGKVEVLVELWIGQRHTALCPNGENGATAGHGACVRPCRCPGTRRCSPQQEFLRQQPRLIEPTWGMSLVDLKAAVKYHLWEC